MDGKTASKIWKVDIDRLRTEVKEKMKSGAEVATEEFEPSEKVIAAMKYLSENKLCWQCGEKMHQCRDSKTGKLSKYIWRCETCMPKGMRLMMG